MRNLVRGNKKSQAGANKEDSNFGTKSFYGNKVSKKSGQDVSENGAEIVIEHRSQGV